MIKTNHCFIAAAIVSAIFGVSSCGIGDDPNSGGSSNASYKPHSVNISDAKSIVNIKGSGSRSVDGEFQKPGVYTIDENGKLSAMALYMTVDKEGNKSTHNEKFTVEADTLREVGDNFIFLKGCRYIDKDGDYNSDIPYHYLVIQKNTQNIFSYDNLVKTYQIVNWFPDTENSLYAINHGNIFGKVTFSNNTAEFRQLNVTGTGIADTDPYVVIGSNGNIYSLRLPDGDLAAVLFSNKGYEYFHDYPFDFPTYTNNYQITKLFACLSDGPYIVRSASSQEQSETTLYKINIGASAEGMNIKAVGTTKDSVRSLLGWYETGSKAVIIYNDFEEKTHCITYDRNAGTLSSTMLDFPPYVWSFNRITKDNYFEGRLWNLSNDRDSVYWLNPETLENGCVNLNVSGIDIKNCTPDYAVGIVVINGIRRSDGSSCVATTDLRTGNTEILATAPTEVSIQLIPLK